MFKKIKEDHGFTLVEMSIVILIIAGLLLLIITNIGGVTNTATKTTDEGIIQTVETQKVIYEVDNNEKADDLNKLVDEYITKQQLEAYNKALIRQAERDEE